MSKHTKHVNDAINLAIKSKMRYMHGAVIVKGGKTVSVGYNQERTRFLKENVPSIHAEIDALRTFITREPKSRLLCC